MRGDNRCETVSVGTNTHIVIGEKKQKNLFRNFAVQTCAKYSVFLGSQPDTSGIRDPGLYVKSEIRFSILSK
jgi:hypothetical protein